MTRLIDRRIGLWGYWLDDPTIPTQGRIRVPTLFPYRT